jgi:transcriptional regulator of acetoin/glycerol metabolism
MAQIGVQNALVRNRRRSMAIARELKIDKNTLRRKIRTYGLAPPDN